MNTKKNIIKNTVIFILVFLTSTILFLSVISKILNEDTFENVFGEYMPIADKVDDRSLNWEKIKEWGGSGFVVNGNKVIRSYNKSYKEEYTYQELLDFTTLDESDNTTFAFNTYDGYKFFLIYPSENLKTTLTFNLEKGKSSLKTNVIFFLLMVVSLYILIIYFIVRWLSYKINNELVEIHKKQEEDRDLLFKGIAHDVKTPLAVILSYSKAIDDNMIEIDKKESYIKSIERNAEILNDRVDDLLEFSSLDSFEVNKEKKDILELTRRYMGNNYSYFIDKKAYIEILFNENSKYFVNVDEKLFERVLQNLLQNSIDHNEAGIRITIDFKDTKLIFKDSGKGIDIDNIPYIFDPLFTQDPSRQGEKLRGMGLSNVRKICQLHNWKIYYKDGFVINF